MKYLLFALLLASPSIVNASNEVTEACRGQILDATTKMPIEYVSIGIQGKNVGTVSSQDGIFGLLLDKKYDSDTLVFSSIGYNKQSIAISTLREENDKDIILTPKDIQLKEVVVDPVKMKAKTLGNSYKSEKVNAGFGNNRKGHELGILLDIKKPTFLEELNFTLVKCSYSRLFYRLNIYRQTKDGEFENILKEPIYIDQRVSEVSPEVTVPLAAYNIVVTDNILVTIEHIKDMGEGMLTFTANSNVSKGATCYFRTTSLSQWEKSPYKFGFNVKVKEEAH